MFNFQDALKAIFVDFLPRQERPLTDLGGRQILMGSRAYANFNHSCPHVIDFMGNLTLLKGKLDKHKIELIYVKHGLIFTDHTDLVSPFNSFIHFIETFHYSTMIYQLLMKFDEPTRIKCAGSLANVKLFMKDSLAAYILIHRYKVKMMNAMRELGVNVIIAPQIAEVQIASMLKDSAKYIGMTYPSLFLFSEVEYVIDEINCEKEMFSCFDIRDLAKHYECSVPMLRKSLLASKIYYSCDPILKKRNKFTNALLTGFDKYPEAYRSLYNENTLLLDSIIRKFLGKFSNSKIDNFMPKEVARFTNLDEFEAIEIFNYFRASIINDSNFNIVTHPRTTHPDWANPYFLRLPRLNMLQFYCHGLISDECAMILNQNKQYTLVLPYPLFQSIEVTYAYHAYYKVNIEICLSRLIHIFEISSKRPFKLRFPSGELAYLDIRNENNRYFDHKLLPISIDMGFFDLMKYFRSMPPSKQSSEILTKSDLLSPSFVSNYLRFNLLHELNYLDMFEKTFLVPGIVMIEEGPDIFCKEFEEEIIIIFELIRNNLFKPSILKTENKFLSQHVVTINDYFVKTLVRKYLEDDQEPKSGFGNESFSSNEKPSDGLNQQNSNNVDSDGEYYDDPEVLSRIERNQLSIQKIVKSFQKDFVAHLDKGYKLCEFEKILTLAFRKGKIDKILLISRFFPFVAINFHTENFYSQDSYQFHELFMVVINRINNINNVNLLSLLKQTGCLGDFSMIQEIKKNLNFQKNYSVDAATLITMLLAQFSIYKVLKHAQHPLEPYYREHISLSNVLINYKITQDLVQVIRRAIGLFKCVYCIIQTMQKYTQDEFDSKILLEMTSCFPLLREFCSFYKIQESFEL
jgi:hypothetical protein